MDCFLTPLSPIRNCTAQIIKFRTSLKDSPELSWASIIQHTGGRGRQISMSSRPVKTTQWNLVSKKKPKKRDRHHKPHPCIQVGQARLSWILDTGECACLPVGTTTLITLPLTAAIPHTASARPCPPSTSTIFKERLQPTANTYSFKELTCPTNEEKQH